MGMRGRSHGFCSSAGCDTATGRVVTFVSKTHFDNHYLEKTLDIPCRVIGVRLVALSGPEAELVLVNVHDGLLYPPPSPPTS